MKKRLINFLLALLGHKTHGETITISVDADQALKTLEKIHYEIDKINDSLKKIQSPTIDEIIKAQNRIKAQNQIKKA